MLTKVDKKRGRGGTQKAEREVRGALERAGCLARTRVVQTSAKSRLGRDEMWKLMRCVVLPDEAGGSEAAAQRESPSSPL